MRYVLIALAGGAGALARYGLEGAVMRNRDTAFPLGTLVVNVSGCFLLGLAFALLTERALIAPAVRTALTVGFLGAFTTFSTFSLESFRLLSDGAVGLALGNVALSVAGGLAAVWAGIVIGRAL